MKNQTLYRGGENKKPRLTKSDKTYNFLQKQARKALAAQAKKKSE